jgi:hypothetical protein
MECAYADVNVPKPRESGFWGMALYLHLAFVFILWPVGLAIHWLLMASFQGKTERLTAIFERSPWKSVLLGLVNLFVIVVIIGVFSEHVPPLGALFLAAGVIVLFIGLHGRSRALGRRILKASGHEATPFAETTAGWTTVTFSSAFPLAGWLAFIYFTAGGLGALTLSLFGKSASDEDKAEQEEEEEKKKEQKGKRKKKEKEESVDKEKS